MNVVERVAQALLAEELGCASWDDESEEQKQYWMRSARAAINEYRACQAETRKANLCDGHTSG